MIEWNYVSLGLVFIYRMQGDRDYLFNYYYYYRFSYLVDLLFLIIGRENIWRKTKYFFPISAHRQKKSPTDCNIREPGPRLSTSIMLYGLIFCPVGQWVALSSLILWSITLNAAGVTYHVELSVFNVKV